MAIVIGTLTHHRTGAVLKVVSVDRNSRSYMTGTAIYPSGAVRNFEIFTEAWDFVIPLHHEQ